MKKDKETVLKEIGSYLAACVECSVKAINENADTKEEAENLYAVYEKGLFFAIASHYCINKIGDIDCKMCDRIISQMNKDLTENILVNYAKGDSDAE